MSSLIDLSTPAPVRSGVIADFTPTLSRALAECFKRRKESLLPQRPSSIEEESETANASRTSQSWLDTTSPITRPQTMSPLEFLNDKENRDVHLSAVKTVDPTLTIATAPITPKAQAASNPLKRGLSTPVTPSLTRPRQRKRRVLEPRNTQSAAPSQLASTWVVDYSVYNIDSIFHEKEDTSTTITALTDDTDLVSNESTPRPNFGAPSCEHETPSIKQQLLRSNLQRILLERQVNSLDSLVQFMELERQFNAV